MRGGKWLRKRVENHIADWVPRLGLSAWRLDVRFDPRGSKYVSERWTTFNGLAYRNKRYLQGDIFFNLSSLARDARNDQEVEEVVVHELIHVLTGLGENETNALARALVNLRRAQ